MYTVMAVKLFGDAGTFADNVGLVSSKQDMRQFMDDYWSNVHSTSYMLMGEQLTQDYIDFTKEVRVAQLGSLGLAALGIVTANPPLFVGGVVAAFGRGASSKANLTDNPFNRILMNKYHKPYKYQCGRAGICVHCLGKPLW